MKRWKWYRAKIKHDNGSFIINIYHYSKKSAINAIIEAEKCPKSAIKIKLRD